METRFLTPRRVAFALLLGAAALVAQACILDFDGLADDTRATNGSGASSGNSSSSTGDGVGGGSSSTTGSMAGGGGSSPDACAASPVLDCAACTAGCAAGACDPVKLAVGAPSAAAPIGVALADNTLYWANNETGSIARIVDKGAPETITTSTHPIAIAAGKGRVVWTDEAGLWGCTADDCEATKNLLDPSLGTSSIQGVAFDGDMVFWTDRGTDPNQGNGRIRRCIFDSCNGIVDIEKDVLYPQGITLAGDSVFWTEQGTGNQNGRVWKAPRSGGSGSGDNIAAALDLPTAIAADTTYVYWTQSTATGAVYRCPHTQGYCMTPEDIAPNAAPLSRPYDIAIAGGRIYFSTADDGSIRSCPLPMCGAAQPMIHVTNRQVLHRLALSSSCLFWTDEGMSGGVFKIAR